MQKSVRSASYLSPLPSPPPSPTGLDLQGLSERRAGRKDLTWSFGFPNPSRTCPSPHAAPAVSVRESAALPPPPTTNGRRVASIPGATRRSPECLSATPRVLSRPPIPTPNSMHTLREKLHDVIFNTKQNQNKLTSLNMFVVFFSF